MAFVLVKCLIFSNFANDKDKGMINFFLVYETYP